MRIGELAQRSGVNERMLRYYEQQELLRPARTESGYRDYDDAQLQAVVRIRQLNESGLKLSAIRVLLPCVIGDEPAAFEACDEIREILTRELQQLETKLRELTVSRNMVASYLATLHLSES